VEQAQANHNHEAIALFQKAVDLDPQFAMAWARIGFVNMMYGPTVEQAKPYLEKAFRLSDRLTGKDRSYITAWYHFANLDFSRAIEELQSLVARYPNEVEAHLELARLLSGEVKTAEALDVARRGLALDPQARDLYNLTATLHGELSQRDESLRDARRYVELAPEEPNAYDTQALLQAHFGEFDAARASLLHALALNPKFEVARVHLGNLHFRQGRYRDAIREYETLARDGPLESDRLRGHALIAWVHFRQGDPAAAAAEMKQHFPSFESAVGLAKLAAAEAAVPPVGEPLPPLVPQAGRGYREYLRLEYYWRGILLLRRGKPREALDFCERADRERPVFWDAENYLDCSAQVYAATGDWTKARKEYERITRFSPGDALAHYHFAIALQKTGATAQSKAENQLFLKLWNDADPDIPELSEARRSTAN
jgi:tetratricopeptide (TPR) repeat protein